MDSLRTDKRIVSVVIRCKSDFRSKNPNTLKISDLLGNCAYVVEPWNSMCQLTFLFGSREIVVTIQPEADIIEIADLAMNHLGNIMKS
jgi:hypothetical protein